MNEERGARGEQKSVTSEGERFDHFAKGYANTINSESAMKLTGESFEYFLERRLAIVHDLLVSAGRPTPRALLDFGCGAGDTQVAMRRRFPEARLLGVDASAESVRVARERGIANATFSVNDGLKLDLPDDSVDVAYSNGTFHHVDHADHAAIGREIHRVIKPGGHVFMFENNGLNPIVAYVMDHNELDRGAVRVAFWKLRKTFADAGFTIRGVHFYAFFPRLLEPLRRREATIRWLPLGAQYVVWGEKR